MGTTRFRVRSPAGVPAEHPVRQEIREILCGGAARYPAEVPARPPAEVPAEPAPPLRRVIDACPTAYEGMEEHNALTFAPVEHPNPQVRQVGFDLEHPYVERCWSAVVGPSSTLLLRRVAALWVDDVPARIDAAELSRSLGLGASVSDRSRLVNTLDRLVRFGLAQPARDGAGLDVHRQVAPLSGRQLDRAPEWTRRAHDALLGTHLDQLATTPTQPLSMTARLDRLQHSPTPSDGPGQAVGL